jgi:hypothetical protein
VVNEPEEQEFYLKKLKFQQILESFWRLHGIFSSFQIFLASQQSKLKEKLKNPALNKFLVVNEPDEWEFSLKNQNFSRFWDLVCACMESSLASIFFLLANNRN